MLFLLCNNSCNGVKLMVTAALVDRDGTVAAWALVMEIDGLAEAPVTEMMAAWRCRRSAKNIHATAPTSDVTMISRQIGQRRCSSIGFTCSVSVLESRVRTGMERLRSVIRK